MKRSVFLLLLFVFFTAAGGFCGSKPEPAPAPTPTPTPTLVPQQPSGADPELLSQINGLDRSIRELTRDVQDLRRGQHSSPPLPSGGQEYRVPVTRDVVSIIRDNTMRLDSLVFYLSSPVTLMSSHAYEAVDGKIARTTGENIEIGINDQGKIVSPAFIDRPNPESINVEIKGVTLGFRRNAQNLFELFSAGRGAVIYGIREFEKTVLVVNFVFAPGEALLLHASNNRVYGPVVNYHEPRQPPSYEPRPSNTGGNLSPSASNPSPSPSDAGVDRKDILGSSALSEAGVRQYIQSRKGGLNPGDWEIVSVYFREAGDEGINPDIAIAQMLYATDFFRKQEVMAKYNYAGFSDTGTGDWTGGKSGEFLNMTDGVRAHIQHLKGYATKTPPEKTIVDPRYEMLGSIKGTISNFDQDRFYQAWSPGNYRAYKAGIENILNGLYGYRQGR